MLPQFFQNNTVKSLTAVPSGPGSSVSVNLLSFAVIGTMTKSNVGRKGCISSYSEFIMNGSQGKKSRKEPEGRI